MAPAIGAPGTRPSDAWFGSPPYRYRASHADKRNRERESQDCIRQFRTARNTHPNNDVRQLALASDRRAVRSTRRVAPRGKALSCTDLTDPHAYSRAMFCCGRSSAMFGNYEAGGTAINFHTRTGGHIRRRRLAVNRRLPQLNAYYNRGDRRDNPSSRIESTDRVIGVKPSN